MRCFHLLFHTGLRQPLCRALCSVRMPYLLSFIFSKYSFIRISREETKRPYSSSVIWSMSGLPTTKTLIPSEFLLTSISSNYITSFQIKVVSVSPCPLRLFRQHEAASLPDKSVWQSVRRTWRRVRACGENGNPHST